MSEQNPWSDPQQPSAPAKKGMSGCMMAFLIIAGIGLIGMLACGGVVAYIAMNVKMKKAEDPKEVTEIAQQILKINIPEGFAPKEGFSMDFIVAATRIANYEQKEQKGSMTLGVIQIKMQGADQGDIRKEFDKRSESDINVKSTKTRDITIVGKPAKLTIGEGTKEGSDEAAHTANVFFQNGADQYFIAIEMLDEIWDEEAVVKMLEEAKLP
jgi:hypothetical protein